MVKINLISSNGLSLGTFRSPVTPRRDEKIVREGTECTVTKVAYDFDAEDIYALVFIDAAAVATSDEQTESGAEVISAPAEDAEE